MRLSLLLDGIEVAFKHNRKKPWVLSDKEFFRKILLKFHGNISKVEKISNRCRRVIREVTELDDELYSLCGTVTRQEKSERDTVVYDGYEIKRIDKKPLRYHRLVMESHLGRKLKKGEIVHHIDCDKLNNEISNLHLCDSVSKHNSIHNNLEKLAGRLVSQGLIAFCKDLEEYVFVGSLSKYNRDEHECDTSYTPLVFVDDEGNSLCDSKQMDARIAMDNLKRDVVDVYNELLSIGVCAEDAMKVLPESIILNTEELK